ncbi:hypothetical protein [Stutzerimonas stutzeri]|jgi:hypothetical protein|nr:hypothetical protein [Stutzerimonas stutzeri]
MFTTYWHAEIPMPRSIAGPQQLWRFVELEHHGPWFYLTINKGTGTKNWRSMIFVATEEEFELMLEDIVAGARIEAVQIVTPARLNGTGNWQMEELTELVRIHDSENGVLGYDFRTASGGLYSDRSSAAADARRTKIYSALTCP